MYNMMTKTKLENVVKIITFKNEDDMYNQLDQYLLSDMVMDGKCMRLKSLQLMDESHAIAYLEEDTSVIGVKFVLDGEELQCKDAPYGRLMLPYQEVQLINELGSVTIEDVVYDVNYIEYCINSCGGRYVEIYLNY